MTQYLYNRNTRMSDMMTRHVELIEMLPRFGIALGFGDRTVKEVCDKWNVDVDFFLLICNVYAFRDFEPSLATIENTNMEKLVPYLKESHIYYTQKRLPHIEKHLHHIAEQLPPKIAQVFLKFFRLFQKEVEAHFSNEETIIFPRLQSFISGNETEFSFTQYLTDIHSDIEDKLADLSQIIFKYLPETIANEDTIDVVSDLLLLARDLHNHSLIEEKILIPFVQNINKKGQKA